jgi:hypothetical protein
MMAATSIFRYRSFFLRGALFTVGIVMGVVHAAEPTGAPKKSPFMPSGTAAASPAAVANEAIEFAGVSSVGSRTDLIFHDKRAKKSRWVGVGETVEGISVVSYDSRREQAVVKINGEEKTLALRKGGRTVHAPAITQVATLPGAAGFAVPAHLPGAEPFQTVQPTSTGSMTAAQAQAAPPMPPQSGPATPEQIAKQESDARMLVSDLLEIGMAQRKAYEEAHRRAAQGGGAAEAPPAPAATTPATPGGN